MLKTIFEPKHFVPLLSAYAYTRDTINLFKTLTETTEFLSLVIQIKSFTSIIPFDSGF